MKRAVWIVAVVVLALALLSARTLAQAPPPNDVNAALIRELHDLRLAIEKLASATSPVQLLSARGSQRPHTAENAPYGSRWENLTIL